MQPYEWGILGVKGLDFYPLFGCADWEHVTFVDKLNGEETIQVCTTMG